MFLQYLKRIRFVLLWSLLCAGIFFLIFVLEEINLKAAVYPTVLCLAFGLLFLLCGYLRYKKTGQKLEHLLQGEGPYEDSLPVAQDGIESGYQELIRKEEQQQRKEHARWEKSGQDMEDYYATWVHQIKAPIAVMNVLLQQEDTETNQNLKAELFRVEQYVEMALGYVRLDSGTKDLVIAQYPLDEIVRKSIRKYAGQFIRRRIRLIYEGTDQIVLTDEKWLSFIIEQLLSNAVKYNRKNGHIYISCREIPSGQPEMTTIEFVCRDTGIGMTEEFQKFIFEPFAQEHAGSRTKFAGTGLGMPISKKLIEKMGGTITFESAEGIGTTFVIRVPFKIDLDADKREEQNDVSEKAITGLHILLTEDNELNMEIAEFVLQNEGADVSKAWNGEETVELFRKSESGEFDAILMDIMMPVMNGYEATKIIRSLDREDAKIIPIIAMTANAFSEDIQHSLAAGMTAHVSKPVEMKVLEKTIRSIKSGGGHRNAAHRTETNGYGKELMKESGNARTYNQLFFIISSLLTFFHFLLYLSKIITKDN